MKYPWMPLFWGDFLANTMHLSAQEAGAYLFLIAHAWEHDGEIPGERVRLARIAHVRHDRWNDVWDVLKIFFEPKAVDPLITGPTDHWAQGFVHPRVIIELQRLGKISSNRKASALQMHSKCSASAEQMHKNTGASASASTSNSNREPSLVSKEGNGHGEFRDKGVEYRSPPRKKSNNVLKPISEKPRRP